ncbi:hypothetical protein DPMN_090372 [Dreissena polymorpha]|uniref:Uncharacterized protein n=1 Tax=Dreissena polymorpha TaxID=45954 RepID=A0A9D4KYH9_DREPO|nr:hypothetical protein DPMN_090372 [Dreissena polymorpha]
MIFHCADRARKSSANRPGSDAGIETVSACNRDYAGTLSALTGALPATTYE